MRERHIKASEGMTLTNGSLYATEIDLGDWDSKENYHEISLEEYERRMKEEAEKEDEQRI